MFKHITAILFSALLLFTIAGCSGQNTPSGAPLQTGSTSVQSASSDRSSASEAASLQSASSEADPALPEKSSSASANGGANTPAAETAATTAAGELTVYFGDNGAPFTMHLYNNSTAAAIAGYVGTADWRLPIYNYDGYDNWEVMQYYDLPNRYEIPSNAETITTEKAGEVFYSEPNRIVLFYGDAEVTGEYSRVGYFEATEEFVSAVRNNPVLEGWGNKIVLIQD